MAAVGQLPVFKIFGAGVGGAAQHKDALALFGAVGQIGADGIQTHVGGQRDEIRLKIAGKMRFGVHFGGLCDVAALDVGNDRQAGGAGHAQGFGVGAHSVQAQRLIIGDLHLIAAGGGFGGIDEPAVEGRHIFPGGFCGVHKIGGQIAELGVQAHADRAVGGHAGIQFVHIGHGRFLPVFMLCKSLCRP